MVKPKHKKKKFINKKEAVTFHLVHRSQQDPLAADEAAPQHVLQQVVTKSSHSKPDDRKTEQRKYGVFFDDDYNYLQHLRNVQDFTTNLETVEERPAESIPSPAEKDKSKFKLPSSVFPSEFEESVGMLNKAAPLVGPQLDWDPDIVAAMDEDFDYENPDNELEDDFFAKAIAMVSDNSDDDSDGEGSDADIDSDLDSDAARNERDDFFDGHFQFADEETRSRFTEYSMTSSVIRRNEGLKSLDSHFEKFFERYDEENIGNLDDDDIEGCMTTESELFKNLLDEYEKQKQINPQADLNPGDPELVQVDSDKSSSDSDLEKVVVEEKKEKWDCESILSTYSTLYNHPKLISEPRQPKPIKISRKTGIPMDVFTPKGLTKENLKSLDRETGASTTPSIYSQLSVRSKVETPEEKRARKKEVKEIRRERRMEKKANTLAFKEEKKRQEKVIINLKNNLKGIKL